MATEDIKVVSIVDVPFQRVDENNNYVIRVRVSNTDGSQKSSWSPYKTVPAKAIGTIDSSAFTISQSGEILSVSFLVDANSYRPLYDVFAKWSTDSGSNYTNFEYYDTISVTSLPIDIPNVSVNRAIIRIQAAGLKQEENNNLLIGTSSAFTVT